MFGQIASLFLSAYTACVNWWNTIFTSTGLISLFLGCVGTFMVTRLIFVPILGRSMGRFAGSDKFRRRRSAGGSDSE